MDDFSAWVGRSETVRDVASADRFAALAALLDCPAQDLAVVPPLGHWLLGRPNPRMSDVGPDGHPKRGAASLLPPVTLPRRMWAGGDIEFLAPIRIGEPVARRTAIASITPKQGRSGEMLFVQLEHVVSTDGGVAVRERQDIVYRADPSGPVAPPARAERTPAVSRSHGPTTVELFRYSALTANGHRIHYDRDYARDVEGYPALVVHGPLAATLLLDHYMANNPDTPVNGFSFRARAPLFDTSPFLLCAAGRDLWIEAGDRTLAMTAEVA